jgi:hypothetical protein
MPECCDFEWDSLCAEAASAMFSCAVCSPSGGSGTKSDPYCYIQDAIDAAVDTDEIIVAPGTYVALINFLGKAITLRSSDGPQVTIISAPPVIGQLTVVSCVSGEGPDTVLDGFTIEFGRASYGGGMRNTNSSPTITRCIFRDNITTWGSGCQCPAECPHPGGAAMHNHSSSPTLIGCLFVSNEGINNVCGFCQDIGGTICAGPSHGIVHTSGGTALLVNCGFTGNAGVVVSGSGVLINCIVWGDGLGNPGSSVAASFSNIEGGWPGIGNIDADPLFVDPDNSDFRLQAGSPCIDAGHNNAIAELADTDLDGNPRFADDPDLTDIGCGLPVVVDMGPYESQGVPAEVQLFADLNGDGFVGVADLVILNGCTGSDDPDCCLADLDADGEVGMSDRLVLWYRLIEFSPVR